MLLTSRSFQTPGLLDQGILKIREQKCKSYEFLTEENTIKYLQRSILHNIRVEKHATICSAHVTIG